MYMYVMICLLQVLEVFRGIAENMVAVVNTSLKCFSGMQHLLLNGEGAISLHVSIFIVWREHPPQAVFKTWGTFPNLSLAKNTYTKYNHTVCCTLLKMEEFPDE